VSATAVDDRLQSSPADGDVAPVTAATPAHRGRMALALAVPAALLAWIAAARFLNGRGGIDLPHFDQGLWLASRGRSPASTVFGEGLLDDHFGPAILVFAPLYRLVATPLWLIVGQVAAAWFAVWQIAGRLSGSLGWKRAAAVAGALLLSPPVAWALLWDVHSIVFAVPFALAAVFAIQDDRPWPALAFGLVAAMFRADAAYGVLAAYVVLPGLSRRRLRPALLLLAYVGLATFLEMHLGGHGTAGAWAGYYSRLGTSPVDALTHPWRIVAVLASSSTIAKVGPWLAVSGFLCVTRPRLMVPGLAAGMTTLLSNWPGTSFWGFHYGIAPTVLLAVALIPALRRRPDRVPLVLGGILILSLLGSPFTPVPVVDTGNVRAISFFDADAEARCIIEGIPDTAGVSAEIGPATLLAHREVLFYWPYPFEGVPKLPSLAEARPERALRVDYIIRASDDHRAAPDGFEGDGATVGYARFRRIATTVPAIPSCASAATDSSR
jgi:uncharacterized membrane protein